MDLSDFTKTTKYMPDEVVYLDKASNTTQIAKVVETTWTPSNNSLSVYTFCLRENHEDYQNKVNAEEQKIMQKWFTELGYDEDTHIIRDWIIKDKYKIEEEEQIQNWLKPNAPDVVDPTEVEEI
mgnify:CR=1 FL=1|tara:strand:- start:71 stop:442 length:372 start_codon:yes stop_codon:yes gene_type:complete